jgi:uncharacterized SAM-binding protein YcdF (DUF218 family)
MKLLLLSLVIPPTGFVTLIIIGLLLRGRWHRFGRRLTWAAAVFLLLFSLPIVSYSALVALETDLPTIPPADHPPQAIVVLGAETIRATRNGTFEFRPGLLTLDRLRSAAALHRQTGLPILATGGVSTEQTRAVGLVMEQSLRDDFQTLARWVEWKSRDTWENARYSAEILRAEGITSVYVVTHAWHMKRALLSFQGIGLTVTAAPTPLDNISDPDLGDFMPRASVWQTGYYAMHEWIGLLVYRLR